MDVMIKPAYLSDLIRARRCYDDDVGAPYSLRERRVGVYLSTPTGTRYRPREPMEVNTVVTIHGL